MEIKYTPVKEIRILSIDERKLENLAWCAIVSGSNKLYWVDGFVICMEIHDDAFKYEIERSFFPINQLCYAKMPEYTRFYEAAKGAQIPIVDVSDMSLFKKIIRTIKNSKNRPSL